MIPEHEEHKLLIARQNAYFVAARLQGSPIECHWMWWAEIGCYYQCVFSFECSICAVRVFSDDSLAVPQDTLAQVEEDTLQKAQSECQHAKDFSLQNQAWLSYALPPAIEAEIKTKNLNEDS